MKSLNARLWITAAALVLVVSTASAQGIAVRANVPFAFRVGLSNPMPAGNYELTRNANVWTFTNVDTSSRALAQAGAPAESKPNDTPRLVFECKGSNCALRTIQIGHRELGAYWPSPHRSKSDGQELARIVVVPLTASE